MTILLVLVFWLWLWGAIITGTLVSTTMPAGAKIKLLDAVFIILWPVVFPSWVIGDLIAELNLKK